MSDLRRTGLNFFPVSFVAANSKRFLLIQPKVPQDYGTHGMDPRVTFIIKSC